MRFILSLLICFVGLSSTWGQVLNPVKWDYKIDHVKGNEYQLTFTADIQKGWTVYSQYIDGDGPVPTSINFETEGVEKFGDYIEEGDKSEGFDKFFEIDVTKYLGGTPFVIKQNIKTPEGMSAFSGYLTYMTCDKEKCLPPTDVDFTFPLSGGKTKTTIDSSEPNQNKQKPVSVVTASEPLKENGSQIEQQTSTTLQDVSSNTKSASLDSNEQSGLLDPVKWHFELSKISDKEYELKSIADIQKGWTVYSQFIDGDGPVPTSINFETEGVKKVGESMENGDKKQGFDKIFEIDVTKYLGGTPFEIVQRIKVDDLKSVSGYLTYMTCDKEKCLPPTDVDFVLDLENVKAGLKGDMKISSSSNMSTPFVEGNIVDQTISSIVKTYASPLGNCIGGESTEDRGLWMSFIFGFIGGLLALLTPCVFPMIPLTVSFFTKDTKRKGLMNGLIYGLSIIVIYVTLGLALTAIFGPEALNRLSTNWIANTLFFIIFIVFAFSFFGYYEITLPSSWSTKSDTMADKGGVLGIFFMAFTLALVSFSCTGPIIGSAIVSAASNAVGPAIVMLGFAIALALPFGLFAAFPAWLNTLPQSGGWMTSVKVVLGFLELALAFKFLSVADMTNHWGFLKYELFLGAWVIIFLLMALYFFGLIRFPHDSPLKKISPIRGGLGFLTFAFVIYLCTGFMTNEKTGTYNSLSLLSGLAPPAQYSFFKPIKEGELDPLVKEKYPSYTMCANNIPCFKDYYEGLNYAKEVDKMVFLDFTGFGCVNCRKVEEHIWVDDEIRRKLSNDAVLISLYVDSDKKLKDVKVSKRDGKKIRNVGNKWADFQIVNFEQNSQPLYVMMTPEEEVIAKPRGYRQNEGIDEYDAYMECGLNTYNNLK